MKGEVGESREAGVGEVRVSRRGEVEEGEVGKITEMKEGKLWVERGGRLNEGIDDGRWGGKVRRREGMGSMRNKGWGRKREAVG